MSNWGGCEDHKRREEEEARRAKADHDRKEREYQEDQERRRKLSEDLQREEDERRRRSQENDEWTRRQGQDNLPQWQSSSGSGAQSSGEGSGCGCLILVICILVFAAMGRPSSKRSEAPTLQSPTHAEIAKHAYETHPRVPEAKQIQRESKGPGAPITREQQKSQALEVILRGK